MSDKTSASVPNRPMNIVTEITNLPAVERLGVNPVDRPTLAKADTVSKNRSRKSNVSVMVNMKTTTVIVASERITTARAL